MGKCKNCGKNALPGYEYCMNCKPPAGPRDSSHSGQEQRGREQPRRNPPRKTNFESFYDDDGYLRREVNIEGAEEASRAFKEVTQSQIRQLFQMLKSAEARLKMKAPDERRGFIREEYGKFVTQVEYQVGRGVIKSSEFRDFARDYYDIAASSEKEFRGFVQYITAILARMRTK